MPAGYNDIDEQVPVVPPMCPPPHGGLALAGEMRGNTLVILALFLFTICCWRACIMPPVRQAEGVGRRRNTDLKC